MYPATDLYKIYTKTVKKLTSGLLDITKKSTLTNINYGINLCEHWDTCLDIGGGTGHYLAALSKKFKKGVLVEVEDLPQHILLKQHFQNISVVHAYIENYQPETKFNFILLADLYEHIPDIKSFVAKISTMQESGGVVYIMTPNPLVCGPAPESGIYHTRHKNGHIKHYTREEITELMGANGYRLEVALHEESNLRQRVKRVLYALSRRDTTLSNFFLYRVLARPLLSLCLYIPLTIFESLVYRAECNSKHDHLKTITQCLAYKKVAT